MCQLVAPFHVAREAVEDIVPRRDEACRKLLIRDKGVADLQSDLKPLNRRHDDVRIVRARHSRQLSKEKRHYAFGF